MTVDAVIKTGNVMVDAILNSKLTLITEKRIAVDATAVLEATGLTREELTPIREGLRIELKKLNYL